jgi:hypothetical protein
LQGILNNRMLWFHLVRRVVVLPSCVLLLRQVAVNLEDVFARASYKRPSATPVGNCWLGSLTTGSPAGHLTHVSQILRVSILVQCVPPLLPLRRPPLAEGGACRIACMVWWLNVQSGLQDPGNNTPGILQSA